MAEMSNGKMVVMCNHADAPHVMPTLIMGASGVGIGGLGIYFVVQPFLETFTI